MIKIPPTRFIYQRADGAYVSGTAAQVAAWRKRAKPKPKVMPGQCCEKATPDASAGCAYAYAWTCPVHGNRRVGSSD